MPKIYFKSSKNCKNNMLIRTDIFVGIMRLFWWRWKKKISKYIRFLYYWSVVNTSGNSDKKTVLFASVPLIYFKQATLNVPQEHNIPARKQTDVGQTKIKTAWKCNSKHRKDDESSKQYVTVKIPSIILRYVLSNSRFVWKTAHILFIM